MTTGWTPADPLLSILVALIILRSAWSVTAESAHILLEGAPAGIDLHHVIHDLEDNVDGVTDVHHAHLWSLDGRRSMMTLHARISESSRAEDVIGRIKIRLASVHGIGHATVEIETGDCATENCG